MPRRVAAKNDSSALFPQPPDPTNQRDRHVDEREAAAAAAPQYDAQHPAVHQAPAREAQHYGHPQHDGEQAWSEWGQQWGYNYGSWHGQPQQEYYDDHPQHAPQHPHYQQYPPHSQHEQYPAYQEFLPPVDHSKQAHAKKDAHHSQQQQQQPHASPHYYYPPPTYPPPPQNVNPNVNANPNHQSAQQHESKKRAANGAMKDTKPHPPAYNPPPPHTNWQSHQTKTQYKAREQMIQQHSNAPRLPVYPYDDSFTSKTFDEMTSLLQDFVAAHPNLDLETEATLLNNNNNNKNDPTISTVISWIKEVRWIRRARAPNDEKSPKATRGRDRVLNLPPLPDSLTLTPERIQTLDSFRFPWYHERSTWEKWLEDCQHYRAKMAESDLNVPLKYTEYPSLGNFVNRQRTEYRKLLQGRSSSMTQSKIADLNRVGFTWSVREGGHTAWDTRLMELREYKRKNGHCNVPKIYRENPSLGYWVNEQRFQYRRMINNKPSYMNDAKIAHLNALGFIWTLRESKKPWEDWMAELEEYKKIHGNVDVPLKYEKNMPLGAFVNNQRSEYRKLRKGEPSSMTDSKIRQLEGMGFHWSVRETRTPWTSRLKELKAYKDEFGDVNVPRNWKENPGLSYWVEKQRQQYKLYGSAQCHLTQERIDALNELKFNWEGPPEDEEKDRRSVEM